MAIWSDVCRLRSFDTEFMEMYAKSDSNETEYKFSWTKKKNIALSI